MGWGGGRLAMGVGFNVGHLEVLAILKGMHKVPTPLEWSRKVLPCLEGWGGGAHKFWTCSCPIW